MKETIKLRTPLLVNGEERTELTYDFNEIDCNAFAMAFSYASSKALTATQQGKPNASIMEQNANLHMYLGMMAIIAVNSDVDINDLERMKGFDIVSIAALGRNFINGRSEEHSDPSNSEEPSEATPESSIQESEKSKEWESLNS